MRNFKALRVWITAHQFTLRMYELTQDFPRREVYGLASQMRRAAASIPTNIAEGCGRASDPDFVRFLDISLGSANEAEYQLLLSKDLGYLRQDDFEQACRQLTEIQKMLIAFIHKLRPPSRRNMESGVYP